MLENMRTAYWKIKELHTQMQDGALTAATRINGIVIVATADDTEHGTLIRYSMVYGLDAYTTRNGSKAVNALFNALVFVS